MSVFLQTLAALVFVLALSAIGSAPPPDADRISTLSSR